MIAAFAGENRLATIVETRTAGRLLSAESLKLFHGYVPSLPVGAYYTCLGRLLELSGVTPDVDRRKRVRAPLIVC
jgi:C-terminal processing protease CtpA/Prc